MDSFHENETERGSDSGHQDFLRLFLAAETDLRRYICALTPDPAEMRDLLQETALALWSSFDRYDRTRPFLPWALRVARNKVRQQAEKTGRFPFLLEDETLLERLMERHGQAAAESPERHETLLSCLRKLRPEHGELIRSYYWRRVPVEELARASASTAEAVYKRLQRIRAILLSCIQRQDSTDHA